MMETTVYISSPMDFKSRVKNWWKRLRLKAALQHIGLLIILMGYTVAGGLVFRRFEYPAEISRINYFNTTLLLKRQNLIEAIVNNTDITNLDLLISYELENYEKILQDAFNAGIPLTPQEQLVKWTTLKAVFFSSTVLTTIVKLSKMRPPKLDINKGLAPNIFLFRLVGFWTTIRYKFLYKKYTTFILIYMIIYNITQVIYIIENKSNYIEVASTAYNLLSTVAVVLKVSCFLKNFSHVLRVKEIFENDLCQPFNQEQTVIVEKGMKLARSIFYFFFYLCQSTIIMWIIFPLFENNQGLPSKAWFPFDYKRYYVITYVCQAIIVVYHAFTNICLDTLFAMLMVQIGAQCDLLTDKVINLHEFIEINNNDKEVEMNRLLVKCVKHHKLILELADEAGKGFGIIVFIQFATSVLVLCEALFLLTLTPIFSATFFMLITYQMSIFTQIFLYCWFGNEVILKSEQIFYATFQSDWYNQSELFKKNLLTFMQGTQKPIILTVGNIFPISIGTFTSILRSSWAYFMAQRRINE